MTAALEAAEGRYADVTIMQQPAPLLEVGLSSEPQPDTTSPQGGNLIEFPRRSDPLRLTREEFLELPDGLPRREMLVTLRRNSYDPQSAMQAQTLFPEGYRSPLTEIEHTVFNAGSRVKAASDKAVSDQDRSTLAKYLHDTNVDDAILAFQAEGDHEREGHFWPTTHAIGGYDLNRMIANEIENQAAMENKRDEIRMFRLEDMARDLRGLDIPMREADQVEMERLRAEFDERAAARQAYLDRSRIAGYANARVH